jgi:CBS-domain-containing membrane protein
MSSCDISPQSVRLVRSPSRYANVSGWKLRTLRPFLGDAMNHPAPSDSVATKNARFLLVSSAPPRPPMVHVATSFLGGLLAIGCVSLLAESLSAPLVLGSFGASCVLAFGFPDSPFSQPRNIVLGHLISSFCGVAFAAIFGYHWWSMAIAAATAIAAMQLTRTVHPPAGSNPVIVMLSHASWPFLLKPTLLGACLIAAIAFVYNRSLPARRSYPKYWW